MRAFAEFIMRGRTQAVLVSVLGVGTVLFAWVSAAVIGLVVLRRGLNSGLYILAWTLVPGVVVAQLGGDIGPLLNVCAVVPLAWVLRASRSWQWTLTATAAVGFVLGAVFALTPMGQALTQLALDSLNQLFEQMRQQQQADQPPLNLPELSKVDVAGGLALHTTVVTVISLVLARWWQALLYNPGGFRQEFHQLRIAPGVTAALALSACALWVLAPAYRLWALLPLLPLIIAGFALVHGLAGIRRIGGHWLVVFYVVWLLSGWAKLVLLVLAVVDSGVNIRRRLARGGPPTDLQG